MWEEVIMDDEQAVQSVFSHFYPEVKINLCLFHLNKSILRKMAGLKIISFFRNCSDEAEIYIYKTIKQLFVLGFLPVEKINSAFNALRKRALSYTQHNCSSIQNEKFKIFFDYLEKRYFANNERLKLICKYKMMIRTTNLIESIHSTFNKSCLLGKHQTLERVISGK